MVSICFVLVFFHVIISTFFNQISAQECKNPLPILMKTASGVDITKWNFLPIGGSSSSNDGSYEGFGENVFNFTCVNGSRKWRDAWYPNDATEYDLPDQFLDSVEQVRGSFYENSDRYSIDHYALEAKASRKDGFSYTKIPVKQWLSQSRKTQSLLKQYFDSGKIFAKITNETASNFFQIKYEILSNEFVDFITKKLPPKYEHNPTIYQQFVERFGTHIIRSGKFGYIRQLQFALNQQYAIEHTDWQIVRNLKISFYRAFNIRQFDGKDILENENEHVQVDEDFERNSELIFSYGGNVSKWVDKISGKTFLANNSERVLLWIDLTELSALIENETIKSQVEIATKMYLTKAYLSELKNVYNYTNYQLSKDESESLVLVERLLKANDPEYMDQVNAIIDQLYDKVPMFTDKKCCYPTLYDLYVTANLRAQFATKICAHWKLPFYDGRSTRQCASDGNFRAQFEVNRFFSLYQNGTQGQDCVSNVRELNLEFGLLKDRDNGLGAICNRKC